MGSSGIIPVESFTRSTWEIRPHKFRLQYWVGSSGFIPRECTTTTNISVCTSSGSYHDSRGPILLLVAFVWVCRSTDRNTVLFKCWARRREYISSSCSLALVFFVFFFSQLWPQAHEISADGSTVPCYGSYVFITATTRQHLNNIRVPQVSWFRTRKQDRLKPNPIWSPRQSASFSRHYKLGLQNYFDQQLVMFCTEKS
jgi:hypothetical protein